MPKLDISIHTQLSEIPKSDWDSLANPVGERFDPFLSWDFLEALELSGAASPEEGWAPHHLLVRDEESSARAALPLYLKTHSYGEFVFDHAWADAYARVGGNYYPKLLSAVPFTPVTGRRLLYDRSTEGAHLYRDTLLSAAIQIADQNDLSSLHLNFLSEDEYEQLGQIGFLQRTDQQFHFENRGYESFDDFLAELTSQKRKNLRKERAKAVDGLTIQWLQGDDIQPHHWDVFYAFYIDTGSRKWGSPYLNRETFELIHQRLRDKCLLIFALDGDRPIAGALNLIGSDTLFGRYWGRLEERPFLHFEICYYQAIDYAIKHGLQRVEAGAQGGHKLARGYVPKTTYSAHWIAHEGLRNAIDDYLERERFAVSQEQGYLEERTPFRKSGSDT